MYCHCGCVYASIQTADRVMCKSPVAIHCTHRWILICFSRQQTGSNKTAMNVSYQKIVSISLNFFLRKTENCEHYVVLLLFFLFTLDKYIKIKCSCSAVQLFLLSTVLYTLVEIKTPLENTTHLGELPSLLLSYFPHCNGWLSHVNYLDLPHSPSREWTWPAGR